jgi:hypothetical protein
MDAKLSVSVFPLAFKHLFTPLYFNDIGTTLTNAAEGFATI